MICRMLSALLLLLPACAAVADQPYNRKDTETKLNHILVGKVAVLQKFYKESELHFDAAGNLVSKSETGPWTTCGRVQIEAVQLSEATLQLEGKRNVMRWEGTEMANYTLDNVEVRIAIDLPPKPSGTAISGTLTKIFLFRSQRLSDVVPEYWKDFLTTERRRIAERQKQQAKMMKETRSVGEDVKPPRLLSEAKGIEIGTRPFQGVDTDTTTLQFIVDASGSVQNVQIMQPVGAGADDPIAEEIAQWKFEPAASASGPVSVVMYAKRQIRFTQRPGRDPYHINPCPFSLEERYCR